MTLPQHFEVQFKDGQKGLDELVELAVSGKGEYSLGEAKMDSPLSRISVSMSVEQGTYSIEAVMTKQEKFAPLKVKREALTDAGFQTVTGGKQSLADKLRGTIPDRSTTSLSSTELPHRSQNIILTTYSEPELEYRLNVNGLTKSEVRKSIETFANALSAVVNSMYNATGKKAQQQTLTLAPEKPEARIEVPIDPALILAAQERARQRASGTIHSGNGKSPGLPHDDSNVNLNAITSEVRFTDIGGYDNVKRELGAFIKYIQDPSWARQNGYEHPKLVVLHGPPGTGKTLLGKAVAGESGALFIEANAADFLRPYVGQSTMALEELITKAQAKATKAGKPAVVFIDEIDTLLPERGTDHHVKDELVNLLNAYTQGMRSAQIQGVYFMGATNRYAEMDKSAVRAGRAIAIEVGMPDAKARQRIFEATQAILERKAGRELFERGIDYGSLAGMTDGFSGADIAAVMSETRKDYWSQTQPGAEIMKTARADLEKEIAQYRSSTHPRPNEKKPIGFGR